MRYKDFNEKLRHFAETKESVSFDITDIYKRESMSKVYSLRARIRKKLQEYGCGTDGKYKSRPYFLYYTGDKNDESTIRITVIDESKG